MYDDLGPAIRDHVEALKAQLDSKDVPLDLDIFGKTWEEGGLLPLKPQLRNLTSPSVLTTCALSLRQKLPERTTPHWWMKGQICVY